MSLLLFFDEAQQTRLLVESLQSHFSVGHHLLDVELFQLHLLQGAVQLGHRKHLPFQSYVLLLEYHLVLVQTLFNVMFLGLEQDFEHDHLDVLVPEETALDDVGNLHLGVGGVVLHDD